MKKTSLSALAFAALLTGLSVPAVARVDAQIAINVGPPPLRQELVPAPRRGAVWIPGFWDWRGKRHVWVAGSWARERPGYRYTQPQWVNHNGRWILVRGNWVRGARGPDADRDGIPDRRDRDRDGDGVPNRRDARPDNPYRR